MRKNLVETTIILILAQTVQTAQTEGIINMEVDVTATLIMMSQQKANNW